MRGTVAPAPSGGDDTAALQAAINATPAGGVLWLRPGSYSVPAGGLTCDHPIRIFGHGSSDIGISTMVSGTEVVCGSATADLITFTGASGASAFHDFTLRNSSSTTPTAGSAMRFTTTTTGGPGPGDVTTLRDCSFVGFYDNVVFEQGRYQNFTGCKFLDQVRYGVVLKSTVYDWGDQIFTGNLFCAITTTRIAVAAVYWESGGGLKFHGNKTNGNQNNLAQSIQSAILMNAADGGSTSDLIVTGNSLEGLNSHPIVLAQKGPTKNSHFSNVVVTGNQALVVGSGYLVYCNATGVSAYNQIVISGNMQSGGNGIFSGTFCNGIVVGPNRVSGQQAGTPTINIASTCTDAAISEQSVDGQNAALYTDGTYNPTGRRLYNRSALRFAGTVTAGVTTAASQFLYRILPSGNSISTYTVEVMGNQPGAGTFYIKAVRRIVMGADGTAPTITTVGTDETAGAGGLTLAFDTATTVGQVGITAILPGGSTATETYAQTYFSVVGPVRAVSRGSAAPVTPAS
jgi:hypothetical protein